MKLEVGEFYLSASGEIVKIVCECTFISVFYDYEDNEYKNNGEYITKNKDRDLIAHIPKELHKMICELVNNYHTNNEVKVFAYFNSLWQHNCNTYKDEI